MEYRSYPTVLFYEKLDSEEDVPESKSFKVMSSEIDLLIRKANEADLLSSNNLEEIYGKDMIETQKKINEEFTKHREEVKEAKPKDISKSAYPIPFPAESEAEVLKAELEHEREMFNKFKREYKKH